MLGQRGVMLGECLAGFPYRLFDILFHFVVELVTEIGEHPLALIADGIGFVEPVRLCSTLIVLLGELLGLFDHAFFFVLR